jgi:hypothetical protein
MTSACRYFMHPPTVNQANVKLTKRFSMPLALRTSDRFDQVTERCQMKILGAGVNLLISPRFTKGLLNAPE